MADDNTEYSVEYLDIVRKVLDVTKQLGNVNDEITDKLQGQYDMSEKILEEGRTRESLDNRILNLQKKISASTSEIDRLIKEGLQYKRLDGEALNEQILKYKSMTKAIQNLQGIREKSLIFEDILSKAGYGRFLDFLKSIKNYTGQQLLILGAVNSIGFLVKNLVSLFDKLDGAAADFRISMGFTRDATGAIEDSVRETYFQLAQTGLTADKIYDSYKSIEKSVGTIQAGSKALTTDIGLLNVQLGVATETSAEFAKAMAMMGRSTLDSQRSITLFATKLSESAGTNLGEVMNDVASATRSSYQFMTRSPAVLLKAAVEARRMGTSISDAAKSASSLINFTESVRAEMEASVLLGESINLQRARELSYRRDLKGLNKEILDIAKKSRFEELDPFQQKAVADALGKSADELGKMLQSDREMAKIRGRSDLKDQLTQYEKLSAASDALVKSTAEDARLKLSTLSNQKAITALTAAWGAIWTRILEGPITLLSKILPKIADVLGTINYKFGAWATSSLSLLGVIGLLVGARYLGRIVGWVTGGIGKGIGQLFSGISGGVKTFGSVDVMKGAIGMLLVATSLIPLAFSLKLMQGISWKTFGIMAASLGLLVIATAALGAIMASGVGAVAILAGAAALLVIGAAMIPFAYAAKLTASAIKSLGDVDIMKIAMGIGSLSLSMIPLAAIAPVLPLISFGLTAFSLALRFTAGPAERMGKAAEMLGQGLQTTVNSLTSLKGMDFSSTLKQLKDLSVVISNVSKSVQEIPDIKVEKLQNIIIKAAEINAAEQSKNDEEILKALDSIRASVDNLRSSMERGGIAANVTIDSQKLDSAAARRLNFTGPLSPQPSSF